MLASVFAALALGRIAFLGEGWYIYLGLCWAAASLGYGAWFIGARAIRMAVPRRH
jgi:hypothetical protein